MVRDRELVGWLRSAPTPFHATDAARWALAYAYPLPLLVLGSTVECRAFG